MSKYFFFFPEDTNLPYIQEVKAKDIHKAWFIMNFFFVRFVGYGFTIRQLMDNGLYERSLLLPVLTINHVYEVGVT